MCVSLSRSRWSLSALRRYITRTYGAEAERTLWSRVQHTLAQAFLAVYPRLYDAAERFAPRHRWSCFQLLGVDIDIDSELKPWYIEANVNPSLGGSAAAFDDVNKERMLSEAFNVTRLLPYNVSAELGQYTERVQHWLQQSGRSLLVDDMSTSGKGQPEANPREALEQLALALWEHTQTRQFTRIFPAADAATRHRQLPYLQGRGRFNALLDDFVAAYAL